MKKIKILNDYDLYLTYSWGNFNHGICGHTFEVIDYYIHLRNYLNVSILLCEDITIDTFKSAIVEKYSFSDEDIQNILSNTIFENRPIMLKGTNILFTDGEIDTIHNHVTLFFDNVFLFACGNKNVLNVKQSNWHVLLDHRVYNTTEHVNYVKKIDFKNLKKPVVQKNRTLIYATENCRLVDQTLINTLDDDLLIISNFTNFKGKNVINMRPPIKNIFEQFNKYIYTPLERRFDCSPRFIAECRYFNIEVEYKIDYLDIDSGLKYRKYDIENNFDSLEISNDNFIISYLLRTINENK